MPGKQSSFGECACTGYVQRKPKGRRGARRSRPTPKGKKWCVGHATKVSCLLQHQWKQWETPLPDLFKPTCLFFYISLRLPLATVLFILSLCICFPALLSSYCVFSFVFVCFSSGLCIFCPEAVVVSSHFPVVWLTDSQRRTIRVASARLSDGDYTISE